MNNNSNICINTKKLTYHTHAHAHIVIYFILYIEYRFHKCFKQVNTYKSLNNCFQISFENTRMIDI